MSIIKYSTSFRDFLSSSSSDVARFLDEAQIHQEMPDHPASRAEEFKELVTDKEINYLTFRRDGSISYLPAGKPHLITEDGQWSKEGRQEGKASRVIRKLFTPKGLAQFSDKQFEEFSNMYKANFGEEGLKFELLPATEIGRIYKSTCRPSGSVNSSCMRGLNSKMFEIYENCSSLQILVLWDAKGVLCGRALVWSVNDKKDGPMTIVDRFYVASDYMYSMFKEYCKDNNLIYKEDYSSYMNKDTFIKPDGTSFKRKLTVETPTNFDYYPYIDTFTYGGEGYLTNRSDGTKYNYGRTGGHREGGRRSDRTPMIMDQINQVEIPESEAVMITSGTNRSRVTHRDNAVRVRGEYYWRDSANDYIKYFSPLDQWFHRGDLIHCDYNNTEIPREHAMFSSHHDSYIYKGDAIRVGYQWYHRNEIGKSLMINDDGKIVKKQRELFTSTTGA